MIRKSHFIISFAFMSLVAVSCKKEEGCTDNSATNFSESAEEDNGSCTYSGSVVFWNDEQFSDSLLANNIVSVRVYLNGSLLGSLLSNEYWTGPPACGAAGSLTANLDLGSSKSKAFQIRLERVYFNGQSAVVSEGNYTVNANTCKQEQLEW
jgi:hypothetical protein